MEVPRRNFARAMPTISLAPLVAPKGKGVLLVMILKNRPGTCVDATPSSLFFFFAMRDELYVGLYRAEFFDNLCGILCATSGEKKNKLIRSCRVTEHVTNGTRSGHLCERIIVH